MTSTPAHAEAAVRLAPSGGPSVQMPAGHAFKNAAYGLPNGTPGGTPEPRRPGKVVYHQDLITITI